NRVRQTRDLRQSVRSHEPEGNAEPDDQQERCDDHAHHGRPGRPRGRVGHEGVTGPTTTAVMSSLWLLVPRKLSTSPITRSSTAWFGSDWQACQVAFSRSSPYS